ncbi:MAG: glycoside hydrolase family 2 [Verrucomicrobiota bacterium]|nr:glycoside hydrolase family 2 [Verrucomicrobiota bacterium]
MPNPYIYPRPEYPRPDRQRATLEGQDWINLNGPWQFRFDGEKIGEKEGWFQPDGLPWREQIIVPFCWESLAAWGEGDSAGNENYYATRVFKNPLEVTRQNHRHAPRYEVGWYRREITIPTHPAWEGKRVILIVGAADFFTDCWCNGKHLGHHEGGYLPFEFDITDSLESRADGKWHGWVVFRVEDPMDNKEQPVGKQWRWYTTNSGIWQTVYIEPRSPVYLQNFFISPDIDAGTALFEVECVNAETGCVLFAQITPPCSGQPFDIEIPIANNTGRQLVRINPLHLWNPNEPHLYRVRFELRDGGSVRDLVHSYFGMRKISHMPTADPTAPEVLTLNNVPRYLRGALHQAYYPEGVYTAGDVERFKNDIEFAKKVGFNFLRVHIKLEDPLLLYYADTMGMLIMADFPNFGEGGDTPLGRQRYETMMRAAIKRDFNHPSIFAWCLFNETWGFGGQVEFVKLFSGDPAGVAEGNPPPAAISGVSGLVTQKTTEEAKTKAEGQDEADAAVTKVKLSNQSSHSWVQRMWELAKKLDTTRLIEDMSVVHWEHLDYYAHGDTDINSWHFYMHDYSKAKEHIEKVVGATYVGSTFNYVEGFKQKSQPLINSEYGGIGALDGDRDVSWSFKFLTNELRRHGKVSGYIFTELHDVEWEYNGFMNYDRTPKQFGYDPRIINESDTLPIDAPPMQRVKPGAKVTVPVASSHYSTTYKKNVVLKWHLGGIDTLGKLHQDIAVGAVPIPFPHRSVAHAHTIELEMPHQPMLCTLSIEALNSNGCRIASNFLSILVSDGYPVPHEQGDRITVLRGAPADWARSEWSGYAGNREQERAEDVCYGYGHGYFEWDLPLHGADIHKAYRIRVLCEASSRRIDSPQTDDDHLPSTMQMFLNGLRVYEATLVDHPHDSRGVLSYLREGKGAYGYLAHATAEGELLRRIAEASDGHIRLRCEVPASTIAQNGLSIYGAECGRYPICPTVVIEW